VTFFSSFRIFPFPTPDAYNWIDEDRPAGWDPLTDSSSDLILISEEMLASWTSIARINRNDFIPTVAKRQPAVRTLLDAFNETGSFICSMSGSGSAVFGVYEALLPRLRWARSRGRQ
jgi:4-diphosphocytidyl-2C-methyl-D-erythritol kinase